MEEINIEEISNPETLQKIADLLISHAVTFAKNVILALIVYLVGKWIFKKLTNLAVRIMEKRNVEKSLRSFLTSLINIVTTIILIILVIGILGIDTSSLVALFASAGVAIGLALSGTLQNFAGGVMILLFKPFKVGDFIEAQGYAGTVKEIQIFNTLLTTGDNQLIYLPNGALSTNSLKNVSKEKRRRVEWIVGVAYGEDYDKVKSVLATLLEQDKRILKEPASLIALKELGESSVNIVVRAWVKSGDYWGVFFDMNEQIYKAFTKENISIPFPQMDVHLVK